MLIVINKKGFYFYGKVKELKKYFNELNTKYGTVAQFIRSKFH